MRHSYVAVRVIVAHEDPCSDGYGDASAWLLTLPGSPRTFGLPAAVQTSTISVHSKCRSIEKPTVAQLLDVCLAIESYLEQQPSNVAVIPCWGACRRTHLLLAAFLLFKGIAKQPAAAAKAVQAKLPCPVPDAQPSDLRYLRQVLVALNAPAALEVQDQALGLRTLKLHGAATRWRDKLEVHVFNRLPGAACALPVACFKAGQGMAVIGGQAVAALPALTSGLAAAGDLGLQCLLHGDVLVEVVQMRGTQDRTLLCSALFPTMAVRGLQLTLSRQQLDLVHPDMKPGSSLTLTFDVAPPGFKDTLLPSACKAHAPAGLPDDSPPSSPSSIPAVSSPERGDNFPTHPPVPPNTPQQAFRRQHRRRSLDEPCSSSVQPRQLPSIRDRLRSPFDSSDESDEAFQSSARSGLPVRADSMPPAEHLLLDAAPSASRPPGRSASTPSLRRPSLLVRALSGAPAVGDGDGSEGNISAPATPSCPRPESSMDWTYSARTVEGAAEELRQLLEASQPLQMPPLALAEVDSSQAAALIKWISASWWMAMV